MGKCCICNEEFDSEEQNIKGPCPLCHHLASLGLPHKYMKATKVLYDGVLLKCFDKKDSLYIYGNVGTGKTWLMSALMREHVRDTRRHYGEHGESCFSDDIRFISFLDFTFGLRASMDRSSSDTESKILNRYGNPRALFFDDIGASDTKDYMRSALLALIEKRNTLYNVRTVITSNWSLNQLAKHHGERIASRIAEMCTIIKLTGVDRRKG